MCQFSVVESKSATFPTEKPRHLLDDSVLESHSPARGHAPNSHFTNGLSIGKVWWGGWHSCFSVPELWKLREIPRSRKLRISLVPVQRLIPFVRESRSGRLFKETWRKIFFVYALYLTQCLSAFSRGKKKGYWKMDLDFECSLFTKENVILTVGFRILENSSAVLRLQKKQKRNLWKRMMTIMVLWLIK